MKPQGGNRGARGVLALQQVQMRPQGEKGTRGDAAAPRREERSMLKADEALRPRRPRSRSCKPATLPRRGLERPHRKHAAGVCGPSC